MVTALSLREFKKSLENALRHMVWQLDGVVGAFIAFCQGGVSRCGLRGHMRVMAAARVLEDSEGLREPCLDWTSVLGALWKLFCLQGITRILNRKQLFHWASYFRLEKPIYH